MSTYSTDNDLLIYRSNILSLGVSEWLDQHALAFADINRLMVARWYNRAAIDQGVDPYATLFDPTKVQDGELKALECFKTLEYAYMQLMKDSPEADGYERNMSLFARQFGNEFDTLMSTGVTYDWDDSGTVDDDEIKVRAPRRLYRA